jgi:hypothetical protein
VVVDMSAHCGGGNGHRCIIPLSNRKPDNGGVLVNQPGPAIELVEPVAGQKRWKIELRNLRQLDQAFGRDVLNAFSRCFVHADRLTSTTSCIHASEQLHSRDSVGFERDLNSMVWFTVGTLRELAAAIQDLRASLRKRGRLDPNSPPGSPCVGSRTAGRATPSTGRSATWRPSTWILR